MSDLLERTRAAVETLDPGTIRDALSLILADREPTEVRGRWDELDRMTDFATLVAFLKRNFSFPELKKLTVESGGRVMVDVGKRRVELGEGPGVSVPGNPAVKAEPPQAFGPGTGSDSGGPSGRFLNLEFDR